MAFVVRAPGQRVDAPSTAARGPTQRVGKTQRLADLHFIDELPRSAIGKVLKRELRERHVAGEGPDVPPQPRRPTA